MPCILLSHQRGLVTRKLIMSGLEIVGVILALYPIVIDLAKSYKAVRGSNGHELNRKMRVAFMNYQSTVSLLLASAVSQQELQRLVASQDPASHTHLQDPELEGKLLARLGSQRLEITMNFLTEMNTLLDQVNKELTKAQGTVGTRYPRMFRGGSTVISEDCGC